MIFFCDLTLKNNSEKATGLTGISLSIPLKILISLSSSSILRKVTWESYKVIPRFMSSSKYSNKFFSELTI